MNNQSISVAAITNRQAASLRSTRTMTMISLLASVSFVLSFLEFPVPLSPSFARMDLSDFLALVGAMVYLAGMIYYKNHRPAWLACLAGAIGMAIMAAVTNYFILLPLFVTFMPLDALIASFAEFIPFIHTKLDVVLWNAIPFNLLKGLGIALVTLVVYPKLTPVFRGTNKGR